ASGATHRWSPPAATPRRRVALAGSASTSLPETREAPVAWNRELDPFCLLATPHPTAPLGARVRAPVGWRISDAPGVPPSPRMRGESRGEGLAQAANRAPPPAPPRALSAAAPSDIADALR